MPRNNTFGAVISMVLNETRLASNGSTGTDFREYVKALVRKHQQMLYDQYDWPFMEIKREDAGKTLEAGKRYYDFPAELNLEYAFELWYNFGQVWIKLDRGISLRDYSSHDSDADVRADPPLKWDNYGETQFEVWPLPASNNGEIRFEGLKKLPTLVGEDNDRLALDDWLVVLNCSAEILAANKQADANLKLGQANDRLAQLRARLRKERKYRLGLGEIDGTSPPNKAGWPRHIAVYNNRNPA